MLAELRRQLQALQKPTGLEDGPPALPFGIPAIDSTLGGGLVRGSVLLVGGDPVFLGVVADEPDRAVHVREDLGLGLGLDRRLRASPGPAAPDGVRLRELEATVEDALDNPFHLVFGKCRQGLPKKTSGFNPAVNYLISIYFQGFVFHL